VYHVPLSFGHTVRTDASWYASETLNSGDAATNESGNDTGCFFPSTDAMTVHGLPTEKATALDNLALNNGPTDGVSQTAAAPPTSVLTTLAAAGRNPTDILIPTQAGTDGSGGDDDVDQASASATTMCQRFSVRPSVTTTVTLLKTYFDREDAMSDRTIEAMLASPPDRGELVVQLTRVERVEEQGRTDDLKAAEAGNVAGSESPPRSRHTRCAVRIGQEGNVAESIQSPGLEESLWLCPFRKSTQRGFIP
jgi:hypothetical protein